MHQINNEAKYTVHFVGGYPVADSNHPDALNNFAVITYKGIQRKTFLPGSIETCGEALVSIVDGILERTAGLPVSKESLDLAVNITCAERENLDIYPHYCGLSL